MKVQALVALTSELVNGTTAAGNILLATELRNGVAAATDAAFLARVAHRCIVGDGFALPPWLTLARRLKP